MLADPAELELRKREDPAGRARARATGSCSSTRSSGRGSRCSVDGARPRRLDAAPAFVVAGVDRLAARPGRRAPGAARSARSTSRTTAACTTCRLRSSAAWRSSSASLVAGCCSARRPSRTARAGDPDRRGGDRRRRGDRRHLRPAGAAEAARSDRRRVDPGLRRVAARRLHAAVHRRRRARRASIADRLDRPRPGAHGPRHRRRRST